MSDDLDDFLSELGISKTSDAAPSSTGVAASVDDANEFLDWLNEPPAVQQPPSAAPVLKPSAPAQEQSHSPQGLNEVSLISEAPTPPKLAALPLPSLEEVEAEESALPTRTIDAPVANDSPPAASKSVVEAPPPATEDEDDFLSDFARKPVGEEQRGSVDVHADVFASGTETTSAPPSTAENDFDFPPASANSIVVDEPAHAHESTMPQLQEETIQAEGSIRKEDDFPGFAAQSAQDSNLGAGESALEQTEPAQVDGLEHGGEEIQAHEQSEAQQHQEEAEEDFGFSDQAAQPEVEFRSSQPSVAAAVESTAPAEEDFDFPAQPHEGETTSAGEFQPDFAVAPVVEVQQADDTHGAKEDDFGFGDEEATTAPPAVDDFEFNAAPVQSDSAQEPAQFDAFRGFAEAQHEGEAALAVDEVESNLKLAAEALGFGEEDEAGQGQAAIEQVQASHDFDFQPEHHDQVEHAQEPALEPVEPAQAPVEQEPAQELDELVEPAQELGEQELVEPGRAEFSFHHEPKASVESFPAQKLDFNSRSPSPAARRASEQISEPRGSIGQEGDAPPPSSSAERRVSFLLDEDRLAAAIGGIVEVAEKPFIDQRPIEEEAQPDWSLQADALEGAHQGELDDDFSYAGPASVSSSLVGGAATPPVHAGLSLDIGNGTPDLPPVPMLDLSFNDVGASQGTPAVEERRSSRPSLGSVPQTPSGHFYAAPVSSVRPIPAAERFALWSAALKAFQKNRGEDAADGGDDDDAAEDEDEEEQDQAVCPKALEVLDAISNSKLQGARLVFALRRVWGGALGVRGIGFVDPREAHIGDRTGSLLRALFGYHDPELTLHLDYITSFTWSRQPSLFGFYGGHDAVLELWDLGIVKVHPGFETPQCGSMFFAFGVCASKRTQLLATRTMDEVFALFDEANATMRASQDEASRWAIFASRIARETPRTFRSLLSQVELDLSSLSDSSVFEDGLDEDHFLPPAQQLETSGAEEDLRAPSEVFSIDDDTPAIVAPARKAGSVSSLPTSDRGGGSVDSANRLESVPSLLDAVSKGAASSSQSTTTTGGGWAKWKDMASKTAKQWQDRLAGPIDDSAESQQQQQHLAAHGHKARRIHLVVLDQSSLGCKLSLTKQGLMCVGFPVSGAGKQMERRGVREGDLIHAINGATVLLLPPAVAEAVAQRQERPLYVTIGTSNEDLFKRVLNQERLSEAKRMLIKPLSEFYARHGPAKVDRCEEIIELYAGKERALLTGLFEKYGEFVPGDEFLRCDSGAALVSADEIVDYLERPDDKDHLLVDIRDITERADTGYFASSVLYGHADVMERLKEAKRTYLIGSGRARELSIADPTRAKAEARLDLERTKIIVERLWKEGIRHVAVVQGGYAQVARELRQRQVDVLVISQGAGVDFRLLDTYLKLDYDDPHSVAQFLTTHVSGRATKQRRSSSVVSDTVEQTLGARKPSIGSLPSSSRRSGAEQLEGEDGEALPAPPPGVVQQHAGGAGPQAPPVITREQLSAATAATAKAASAAAKDAAVLASNAWSKWVAPALSKRKQGEQ